MNTWEIIGVFLWVLIVVLAVLKIDKSAAKQQAWQQERLDARLSGIDAICALLKSNVNNMEQRLRVATLKKPDEAKPDEAIEALEKTVERHRAYIEQIAKNFDKRIEQLESRQFAIIELKLSEVDEETGDVAR